MSTIVRAALMTVLVCLIAIPGSAAQAETREECVAREYADYSAKITQLNSLRGTFMTIGYNAYSGKIAASASIADPDARKAAVAAAKAEYQQFVADTNGWYQDEIYIAKSIYKTRVHNCQ